MEHPKLNPPILVGTRVRLRPALLTDLDDYVAKAPVDTFRYFVSNIPSEQSSEGFRAYLTNLLQDSSILPFTCELLDDDSIVGGTTYLDIRPSDKHVEIGSTWYAPEYRGTFVNPECKFLLLQYAFETLGCIKVTLKCDNRNERSKRAIQKLGAKPEGVLRNHKINDFGEYRNTAYFGIIDSEWPEVKSKLMERLNES